MRGTWPVVRNHCVLLSRNLLEMDKNEESDKVKPSKNSGNEIQEILNLDLPPIDDASAWKDFFNAQIYSKQWWRHIPKQLRVLELKLWLFSFVHMFLIMWFSCVTLVVCHIHIGCIAPKLPRTSVRPLKILHYVWLIRSWWIKTQWQSFQNTEHTYNCIYSESTLC